MRRHRNQHDDAPPAPTRETVLRQENGRTVIDEDALRRHVEADACNKCPMCGREFTRLANLVTHMKEIHGKVKAFECDVCKKTFARKYNMQVHQRTHMTSTSRPHVCKLCGKRFSQRSNLKRHQLVRHEKRGKCPKCDERFDHDAEFERHWHAKHRGQEVKFMKKVGLRVRQNNLLCVCTEKFDALKDLVAHQRGCAVAKQQEREARLKVDAVAAAVKKEAAAAASVARRGGLSGGLSVAATAAAAKSPRGVAAGRRSPPAAATATSSSSSSSSSHVSRHRNGDSPLSRSPSPCPPPSPPLRSSPRPPPSSSSSRSSPRPPRSPLSPRPPPPLQRSPPSQRSPPPSRSSASRSRSSHKRGRRDSSKIKKEKPVVQLGLGSGLTFRSERELVNALRHLIQPKKDSGGSDTESSHSPRSNSSGSDHNEMSPPPRVSSSQGSTSSSFRRRKSRATNESDSCPSPPPPKAKRRSGSRSRSRATPADDDPAVNDADAAGAASPLVDLTPLTSDAQACSLPPLPGHVSAQVAELFNMAVQTQQFAAYLAMQQTLGSRIAALGPPLAAAGIVSPFLAMAPMFPAAAAAAAAATPSPSAAAAAAAHLVGDASGGADALWRRAFQMPQLERASAAVEGTTAGAAARSVMSALPLPTTASLGDSSELSKRLFGTLSHPAALFSRAPSSSSTVSAGLDALSLEAVRPPSQESRRSVSSSPEREFETSVPSSSSTRSHGSASSNMQRTRPPSDSESQASSSSTRHIRAPPDGEQLPPSSRSRSDSLLVSLPTPGSFADAKIPSSAASGGAPQTAAGRPSPPRHPPPPDFGGGSSNSSSSSSSTKRRLYVPYVATSKGRS